MPVPALPPTEAGMPAPSPQARIHPGTDGLVVECRSCGLLLHQVADDRDVALGSFLQHHPMSPEAFHVQDVPAGWCVATQGEPSAVG